MSKMPVQAMPQLLGPLVLLELVTRQVQPFTVLVEVHQPMRKVPLPQVVQLLFLLQVQVIQQVRKWSLLVADGKQHLRAHLLEEIMK
jgi:hypothetical protein